MVWTRSHAQRRAPLTRQAIVTSAVSLADREGLGAVSIRRIAGELGARPMSIYSFAAIETKDELFDLMIDEVSADLLLPTLPQNWREAVLAIALRLRLVLLRHPWWIDLIGRNVLIGPNGIRYREQTLAALGDVQIDDTLKLAVSTGSACTSAAQEPSYVLRALGRDERLAESSLRFSLGRFTTGADVDAAVAAVTRAVMRLRGIAGHRGARRP